MGRVGSRAGQPVRLRPDGGLRAVGEAIGRSVTTSDHADELHRTRGAQAVDATDPTVVTSKPRCWRWCSHSQRSEGSYISGRKEGHEFRTTLSGRALYTVPEAMEMLNLSRTVIYEQIGQAAS